VLYYKKVTKFVKNSYIGISEDFCVLYYIKVTKFFLNLQTLAILEIFVCYTT